ncbi:5'-nucleotidase C-terminal domain-containing protein [Flagellimonas meridianipacifica]|uniref:5'-nucleotidase-like protein n=1 Tax=Flagellimonas meridianipacifica TaxID=1080225 RepID=A0A2T0MAF3_9FLAO|nr:5'-nucleotidase [Allomuricauda pacifica]PRX54504.1 5'-nucleotidase-like protein [Allomuricauda pacifica]
MNPKIQHFVIIITLFSFACKTDQTQLTSIEGTRLNIDTSLTEIDSIENFISPFKERVDTVLDSTLAYAPRSLVLNDGKRNTSMGNFVADLVFEETSPIVKRKINKRLDFVVLNRGGIRSILSEGTVTARNGYEIMPFENYISVVKLNGTQVRELILFLTKSKRTHPFSGMEIVIDSSGSLESVNIQGEPFDESRSYYVATSDYLVSGGADIGFFPAVDSILDTEYLLRNAIIDYFKKQDTLTAKVDDRFIQLN